jgi:hypothetical protein
MVVYHSRRIGRAPMSLSRSSALHTTVGAEASMWKHPTLEAASKALLRSNSACSDDAKILFVVLSFFASCEKIPEDLLIRGSTSRRRWNWCGEIEEVAAIEAGLISELGSLLPDTARLNVAFHELMQLSAISEVSSHVYMIDNDIATRVHESLCPEMITFWSEQALILTYRAIPWKYIEPA